MNHHPPPVRLADDPAYIGIQLAPPPEEANLTITHDQALELPEAHKLQAAVYV